MNGTFELNKPGNYTVELFEENHFLNDKNSPADLAKFGKTYSVKFSGDAETYLWTTKTEPVEGKAYYGHIQPTSGKMLRFKVDKLEDGNFSTGPSMQESKPYLKDITDMPDRWMGRLLPYFDAQNLVKDGKITEHGRNFIETAIVLSEESMTMVDKVRNSGSQGRGTVAHPTGSPKATQATETPQSAVGQSLGDKFRATRTEREELADISHEDPDWIPNE